MADDTKDVFEKVEITPPEVLHPKVSDSEVVKFIKHWEDPQDLPEEMLAARKFTSPRGISRKCLGETLAKFIAEGENNGAVKLYVLKEEQVNLPLKKGQVFRGKPESGSDFINGWLPGYQHKVRLIENKVELLDRAQWTVGQVIDYKLSIEYREIHLNCFYDQIKNEPQALGEHFEGVFCVVSRKCIFKDLVETLLDKAEEDNQDYLYLDFLAVNQAEKDKYRKDSKGNRVARRFFINNVCPYLINSFDKVYVYVDDWKNANIFTRGWCMYELYWAFARKVPLELVYPAKVKRDFGVVLTEEFDNDYFTYHDMASTIVSTFQNFDFTGLTSESAVDKKIITDKFTSLEKESGRAVKNVTEVLRSNLLNHFAVNVVAMGNFKLEELMMAVKLKEDERVKEGIKMLRRCGFYLRKIGFYFQAIDFYFICGDVLTEMSKTFQDEEVPRQTLRKVSSWSACSLKVRYDTVKCLARIIISSNSEGSREETNDFLERAINEHRKGELVQCISCCAHLVLKLEATVSSDELGAVHFESKELEILREIIPGVTQLLVQYALMRVEELNSLNAFHRNAIKYIFEQFDLDDPLLAKVVAYCDEISNDSEVLLKFQNHRHYASYLLNISVSDIDLASTSLEARKISREAKDCFTRCESALQDMRRLGGEQELFLGEVYLKLDHTRVLRRSQNPKDQVKLGALLTELKQEAATRRKAIPEMNRTATWKHRMLIRMDMTYCFIVYELTKYNYHNEVATPRTCATDLLKLREILDGISTTRAQSLKKEIQTQYNIWTSGAMQQISRTFYDNRNFVERGKDFSYRLGFDTPAASKRL